MPNPLAWNTKVVTATGTVLNAGDEFGGISMVVAGTSTTVTAYDNTEASGQVQIPISAALTVGQFVPPNALPVDADLPAVGVRLKNGLHLVVGGTGSPTFLVYWR